jgi:hypothetical protein
LPMPLPAPVTMAIFDMPRDESMTFLQGMHDKSKARLDAFERSFSRSVADCSRSC